MARKGGHYHKSSVWFECPKKSLLKSSHPTKILATFSCPLKNPESKISTLCCLKLASNNSKIFGYVEKCFTGIVINRYTLSPPPLCTLFDFEFDSQMWPQILYKEALNACKLQHFIERRAVKDHSTVFSSFKWDQYGLVQMPCISWAKPNWISLTLEQHWCVIWFRLCTVCGA